MLIHRCKNCMAVFPGKIDMLKLSYTVAALRRFLQFFKYAFANGIYKFFSIFITLALYKTDNRHYQLFGVSYFFKWAATTLAMAAFISALVNTWVKFHGLSFWLDYVHIITLPTRIHIELKSPTKNWKTCQHLLWATPSIVYRGVAWRDALIGWTDRRS